MTKIVQVVATVEETLLPVSVTGAPAGAGVAVAYTTQSTSLSLTNTSLGCDVQYKVASGAWLDLERGCGIDIAIDFSTTALYLRRSTIDGGPATCSLSIDGVPVVRVSNQLLALGSAGASTYAALTDKTTADLPAINTPLAAALAARPVPLTAVAITTARPVALADFNRRVEVTSASPLTLPIDATGAVVGDYISLACNGAGTVTTTGPTAPTGMTLIAATGFLVEFRCFTAGTMTAITPAIVTPGSSSTPTVNLVDADFTSNNLNLTSAHTNVNLNLAAVTIPVTLTWQTDVAGGYSTTSCRLTVFAGPLAPVAIINGASAIVIGGAQVIEQGSTGGGWRTAVNTFNPIGVAKSQGTTFGANALQVSMALPRSIGSTIIDSVAMSGATLADSSTLVAIGTGDGIADYGGMRRVRNTSASATSGLVAGFTVSQTASVTLSNAQFPCLIAGGIADAVASQPSMMGFTGFVSMVTDLKTMEPSATGRDMIVVGNDSTDANMQLMHNVNAGIATKINLGASFPVSQFVGYSLTIWKNNAGTAFLALVTNLNTKAVTVRLLTTNLPRTTSGFSPIIVRGSRTAATVSMDFAGAVMGRA